MMDGSFSHDMTGAMALIPGAGRPVSEVPFIKTPGLLARPADMVFSAHGLHDLAVAIGGETGAMAAEGPASVADDAPDAPDMVEVAPPVAAPQPVMPVAAQVSAARIAEARAEARAEVLADLAATRADLARTAHSLATALERIAHPGESELSALTSHLGQAVAHLAAQRAGQAIDADAAPFARRIKALVARVTESVAQVSLRLHPDDVTAIAALLQEGCPPDLAELTRARLYPDPTLNRGDVALRAPGLRLEDRITPDPAAHDEGQDDA